MVPQVRLLLNRPWVSYVAAMVITTALMIYAPTRATLTRLAFTQSPTLIGVMVSLLGFVIAALAIVIAVQDKGFVSYLKETGSTLWDQLMAVFASTSKVVGIAALYFFLLSSLEEGIRCQLLSNIVTFLFGTLLTAVGLQIAKVIHVLERVGSLAGEGD